MDSPLGESLLDHPIMSAMLYLREGSQMGTLMPT